MKKGRQRGSSKEGREEGDKEGNRRCLMTSCPTPASDPTRQDIHAIGIAGGGTLLSVEGESCPT